MTESIARRGPLDSATAAAKLNIFEAVPMIIGEVAPIAKSKSNTAQGYKFRGIDDVYAALNLLLAKHGVSILPEVLESKHEISGTTKSGSNMYRHLVKIRYTLVASDGSMLHADSEGEGMDTGDKAVPKAFSTAFKTMAFQVFCIPVGDKIDSEEDSPEVVSTAPETKTRAKPITGVVKDSEEPPHDPVTGEILPANPAVAPDAMTPEQINIFDGLLNDCGDGFEAEKHKENWLRKHTPEIRSLPKFARDEIGKAYQSATTGKKETK